MKKEIIVAKEFYETFERLKYNEDFIKFREELVEKELSKLADKILMNDTVNAQDEILSDIRLYQRTLAQYETFFDVSEDQAKQIRKTIKQREKKTREDLS